MRKTARRIYAVLQSFALVLFMSQGALAGNYATTWQTAPFTWTATSLGPNTFTFTDQFGFQVQGRFTITQSNGASAGAFPDDLLTDGAGNTFGTEVSLWMVWNPNLTGGGIGGSTNTTKLELLDPTTGSALGVNGLSFRVSDIDMVDSNIAGFTNDRCDFVTFTGSSGNPTLTAVGGAPTFTIGGTGAGATGAIAANQAQCKFNVSTATATTPSNGDTNGTVQAVYPNGTSVATVAYDESIHNVTGITTINALARGIGAFGATTFTVPNNTISLTKTAVPADFSAVGNVVAYNYVVTNNGPLAINAGQNIIIQDSKIGAITCPAVPAAGVASGATFNCSGNYTIIAADVTAGTVTNTATAAVGTIGLAFASRIQSNTATATIVKLPTVQITKVSNGGVGSFTFTGTNGWTSQNITTVTAGTGVPGAKQKLSAVGVATNLIETITPAFFIASANCTGMGSGGSASLAGSTLTLNAAAVAIGSSILCTFTNTKATPQLTILKTPSTAGPVPVGTLITYTYKVTNSGNVPMTAVTVSDVHNGTGTFIGVSNETLLTDVAPAGDSTDAASNGIWDTLAPGDSLKFTATYSVSQNDVDYLQ